MSDKRMLSKQIVRSDEFLDMSPSARELYFQLALETDDRGFVPNAKSIKRLIGASDGDLEQLIVKKFVLVIEDMLLLIKHHLINNTFRADRFKGSPYDDKLKGIYVDENGAYTTRNTGYSALGDKVTTNGIPMVSLINIKLNYIDLDNSNDRSSILTTTTKKEIRDKEKAETFQKAYEENNGFEETLRIANLKWLEDGE